MVKDLHQPTTSFLGTYQCTGIFLRSFHNDVRDCLSSVQYQPTPFTSWNTQMLMLDSDWKENLSGTPSFHFLVQLYRICKFSYWFYGSIVQHWWLWTRSEFQCWPVWMQRGLMINSSASWGHPQSLSQIWSPDLHLWLVFTAGKALCSGTLGSARQQQHVHAESSDVNQGWMQTMFYWSNSLTNQDQSCHLTNFLNSCENDFAGQMRFPWQFFCGKP